MNNFEKIKAMDIDEMAEEIAKLGLDVAILEQENKALKDNLNHLQVIIDDGRAENKRFREENKELKKQLSSTKCYLCGEGFLTPEGAELYEENKQMKSALEEIRILATKNVSIENFVKIQNKINEVL